jgi:hypothetical protein
MLVNHHKVFHKLFLPIHQNIFERVIGFCFFDKIFQVLFLEDVFAIKNCISAAKLGRYAEFKGANF